MFLFLFSCVAVQFSQGVAQYSQTITNYGSIVQHERIITYFQCSFAYEGLESYSKGDWWPTWEPCGYPNEKGIWHWVVVRRTKEPYSGNMRLIPDPADHSRLCLETIFDYPGARPLPENQHCYVNNIQEGEKANWPEPYTTSKQAYYSFKIWFPQDFEVKRWRLFWSYRGERSTLSQHFNPQMCLVFNAPEFSLNLGVDDYFFNDEKNRRFALMSFNEVPREQWVRFTIYVKQGSGFRVEDGTVIIWINERKVFERHDLPTATVSGAPYVIWGIGNYGGGEELEGQYLRFKDVVVSSG